MASLVAKLKCSANSPLAGKTMVTSTALMMSTMSGSRRPKKFFTFAPAVVCGVVMCLAYALGDAGGGSLRMFHVKHTRFGEVVRKCLADFQFVVGRFEIGWLQRIPRRTDQHAAISDGKLAPVRRAHQTVAFNIRHARALMWAS